MDAPESTDEDAESAEDDAERGGRVSQSSGAVAVVLTFVSARAEIGRGWACTAGSMSAVVSAVESLDVIVDPFPLMVTLSGGASGYRAVSIAIRGTRLAGNRTSEVSRKARWEECLCRLARVRQRALDAVFGGE